MIPYEELSAALERWRVKNGLPGTPPLFAEGSTMKRPAAAVAAAPAPTPSPSYSAPASVPSYSAPSYSSGPSYGAPAPSPAPTPARVPAPPSPETLDEGVDEFAEDDVLAEAELDNDGPDFAMSFSDAPPPARPAATTLTDEDEHESTTIGATSPGLIPPEDEDEFNAAEKTPV